MIPKRVVLENFLSFGTPKTEIAFTDDEPLWVLGGANGVGKSAVFDAMTFALFGEHRGGKQNADLLVRHGANGFSVVFEFEFAGIDYRIARNRMGTRSTASVEQKTAAAGKWVRVENVDSVSEVRGWSERTLGLEFNAFSASVLLRQGKADEIITATGARRLDILKKIIAAERYEALSDRVHAAAKKCKDKLADLKTLRESSPAVTSAEVEAARGAVEETDRARTEGHENLTLAVAGVGHAKRWADLHPKRKTLCEQIREAEARAADAEDIRRDKMRLDDLAAAVPVLRKFVAVRDRVALAERALDDGRETLSGLTAEVERLTQSVGRVKQTAEAHRAAAESHEREAKRLREEAARDEKLLSVADGIATLRLSLSAFPSDLDDRLVSARDIAHRATRDSIDAGNAKAEAGGLLKRTKARQKEFETVGIGVNCSRCGQEVTPEHAERERADIAAEVRDLEERVRDAEQNEREAVAAKTAAEVERDLVDAAVGNRAAAAKQLADQERTLADFGFDADAGNLCDVLSNKKADAARHSAAAVEETGKRVPADADVDRTEADRKTKAADLAMAEARVRECEKSLAADTAQCASLFDQLSTEWQSRAAAIDPPGVEAFDAERSRLAGSGVAERFKQLEQDAARHEEWVKQLAGVEAEIALLPEPARVPIATAEAGERAARTAAAASDLAWQSAKDAAAAIARQAAEYRKLVSDIAATERQHDLRRKLDDLLGKQGLQRELVRGAEEKIVRLANDTVQNLSGGDLSLELDRGEDSTDEAFALRVQQADKSAPTGVDYLSGSQKFRVAVAVALAIGRFAAGEARPLECVIIDEGFGSLDRDGLRAARDELNRLSKFLRRVILVSHQEDFASEFPVVIQLKHGPNGTTAEAVRR